jgi:phosphoribosylglycinamide formyltransferase-1
MSYPIVILGSGRGSNAEALLKAEASRQLGQASVAALFSDHEDAGILDLGQKYKVPAIYIDPLKKGAYLDPAAEQAYIERIDSFSPKLIVLAGFMRILRPSFIEAFAGRVINLHPSLLPSFKGADGIAQAYKAGVKITGCSVHWVTPALDDGPIIEQKAVRIDHSDTLTQLEKKIHVAEHQLLPDVVARMSKGDIPQEIDSNT